MSKIPVGQTIGQAYAFAFGHYLQILGVIWLPLVLLAVAGYFLLLPMFGLFLQIMHSAALHPDDRAAVFNTLQQMQQLNGRIWLFDILELLVFAIVGIGVVKEALGVRTGFRFAYLRFGREEGLLAGAFFVFAILMIVFIIVAAIAGALIAVALGAALGVGTSAGGAAAAARMGALSVPVVMLAVTCTLLFISVRFLFFAAPVSVVERVFSLFRSWELSRGNFWRIFAVLFVCWVPILIVIEGAFLVIAGSSVVGPIIKIAQANPKGGPQAAQAVAVAITSGMVRVWPYLAGLSVVSAPLLYGLIWSPGAFAYRALVPAETPPAAAG